jgi:hypothetical protein
LAVTCSLGCATQPADASWDFHDPDEALYDAKDSGRSHGVGPARTRGVSGGGDLAQTLSDIGTSPTL